MNILSSSNTRTALIKKNIAGGILIKGMSILISLMLIPLTINYVNSELYGIWLTLSSVISWINYFDIGFGNGLKNKLTHAIALGEIDKGKSLVSTTYFSLIIIFGTIGTLCYLLAPLVNWSSFLNVSSEFEPTLLTAVRIVFVSFSLQFILKVITNVIQAHQYTSFASGLDMVSNLISLAAIFILTKTTLPNFTLLAIVFCLSPLLVSITASFVLYKTKFKSFAPSFKSIQKNAATDIFTLGSKFFIIQISYLVLYQTTNIIISKVAGPESVTQYNIVYKYLNVALMAFNIIIAPIWTAFSNAYAKKDYSWMNSIYKKLLKLYLLTIAILFIMVIISPIAYDIWVGQTIIIPQSLTITLSIYMASNIWNTVHVLIINGTGKIRLQLYIYLFSSLINVPTALYLGSKFGSDGVIYSMIFFSIFPAVLIKIQLNKILKEEAKGIWGKE